MVCRQKSCFLRVLDRTYCFLMVQGHKILNFSGPAQKIWIFMAWGQKILVCSGLETENIGF